MPGDKLYKFKFSMWSDEEAIFVHAGDTCYAVLHLAYHMIEFGIEWPMDQFLVCTEVKEEQKDE